MPIPRELKEAYQSTTYKVFKPSISIRIGSIDSALEELLTKHQVSEWCFITAWNPESKSLSPTENEVRNNELVKLLQSENYIFYEGAGVPDTNDWQPEASFLVLGISKAKAIALCKEFGQNGVVFGIKDNPAELLIAEY